MAKLYYGDGNCSIESGESIRGVQIKYRGAIEIEDKTSDSFVITHQKNGILIFPIGEGTLDDLFDYIHSNKGKREDLQEVFNNFMLLCSEYRRLSLTNH